MTKTKAMSTPLKEDEASNPQVKSLIQNCNRITNGRIYLHRWNIEKDNAPIGFAVKGNNVETINGALESLVGKGRSVSNCLQYDLSTHSKIKGTHLNVYHSSGKMELQGSQQGDGRSKRFPPSTRYACEGFLDVLHHLSSALESNGPSRTSPTTAEIPISPETGNREQGTSGIRQNPVSKKPDTREIFSETENQTLQQMKSFLSEFPSEKRKMILENLQDSSEEPKEIHKRNGINTQSEEETHPKRRLDFENLQGTDATPLESTPSQMHRGNTPSGNHNPEPKETTYRVQPVILHHNFPTEIRDNPNEVKKILNKMKPTCSIKEVKTLKSGDLLIIGESEKDYNSLLKPWDQSLGEIKVKSRLPDNKSLSHEVLIRGIPTSVTEEEIKLSLLNQNITPKNIKRFVLRSGEALKTVKVTLGLKSEKDLILSNGVKLGYESFRCVEFKEQPKVTQCFRCQSFEHTSHTCNKTVKCLRCAGEHRISDDCKNASLKCCNCGESHFSNYKGCKAYKAAAASIVNEPRQDNERNYATTAASRPAHHGIKPAASTQPNPTPMDSRIILGAMAECMFKLLQIYRPDIQVEATSTVSKVICDVGKRYFRTETTPELLSRITNSADPNSELIRITVENARNNQPILIRERQPGNLQASSQENQDQIRNE